jgi:hypothetical protein
VKADDLRLGNKGYLTGGNPSSVFLSFEHMLPAKAGQKGKSQNEPEQPEKPR